MQGERDTELEEDTKLKQFYCKHKCLVLSIAVYRKDQLSFASM